MHKQFSHIICFTFLMISLLGFSQNKPIKGYHIDGDSIVFTFDKRDYEVGTHFYSQERLDFEDFNIKNVAVSGYFNEWSKDGWKMTKLNDNVYQLKKNISDFNDDFNWEFKFVVNNSIWAEPTENIQNIVVARTYYGGVLNSYNLKIYRAYIKEDGNAVFKLNGYKNAKKVILAGSFNKWDEHLFEMKKTKSGWELTLELPANAHQYRFIVDGTWIEDPHNPNKVENEYSEYNSVIDIKKEVSFILDDYKDAKKVILAGSFNDWSENSYKLKKTSTGWMYTTKLSAGKYHYKFIVDGEWIIDPKNTVKEYDGDGNINSVKMVR